MNELKIVIFTPVAQSAARRVELQVLRHVLSLDAKFHLDHQVGQLARIIERGTRAVSMIFRAAVFQFMPTLIEICAVSYILRQTFDGTVVLIVAATFVLYVCWTVALTQVSVEIRKEANARDQRAEGKLIDALINENTVSLFGNTSLECRGYGHLLRRYHRALIWSE